MIHIFSSIMLLGMPTMVTGLSATQIEPVTRYDVYDSVWMAAPLKPE
jgi:hypothetical protein